MKKAVNDIVILGGGTAGWLSAIYLQQKLDSPDSDRPRITLIESSDIGTVGVGEATLLTFPHTLSTLGIDEAEFMRNCNASLKMGIKFINWATTEHCFWFPFRPQTFDDSPWADYWIESRRNGSTMSFVDAIGSSVAGCRSLKSPKSDLSVQYQGEFRYAYHLDAGLLATFLKEEAKKLGVIQVVDTVTTVELTKTGSIDRIATETGRELSADLFIDCSGFRGELINRALSEPFVSYSDVLLCDRAIAINTPNRDLNVPVNPYVSATALNAGWAWHIPLHNRVGNGYVYSGNHVDPEKAEAEFRRHLGECSDGIEARHIRMRVGRNRRSWVENCVSLGLASGFIEPLESTGIYLLEIGLQALVDSLPSGQIDATGIESFNRRIASQYDDLRDFIVLHYNLTRRDDTEFWRANAGLSEIPETLRQKIDRFRETGHQPRADSNFGQSLDYAYLCVLDGLDFFDDIEFRATGVTFEEAHSALNRQQSIAAATVEALPDHRHFLNQVHNLNA